MINPALNAAILTSINTLQAAGLVNSPCIKWALIGGIQLANATCAAATYEEIDAELNHIIQERPVAAGVQQTPRPGYLQADLHALS